MAVSTPIQVIEPDSLQWPDQIQSEQFRVNSSLIAGTQKLN